MTTKMSSFKRLAALLLVVMTVLTLVPVTPAYAAGDEGYYGGLGYAWQTETVYSDAACTNKIGTIYKGEGYTILYRNWDNFYVEYSTPSGAKRGYVSHWPGEYPMAVYRSCVSKITANSTVYAGPDTSRYAAVGTVYAGELVAVIGRNDYPLGNGYTGGWIYIEYNTTSGRKRGYMIDVNNYMYSRPDAFPDFYMWKNAGEDVWISGTATVYYGMSTQYAVAGQVKNENVTVLFHDWLEDGDWYTYIEYSSPSGRKSGFIHGYYSSQG